MIQSASPHRSDGAAMFVDYENVYSVLTAQSASDTKTSSYADEILEEVRRYLEEGDDTPTIFGRAYGPFDVLLDTEDADVPESLHRQGIEPTYVPSAMQSNTSEVRLTIEVSQFLAERPDVNTIVIVTGDRPYLPLVRTIREEGRRALVAAVNPPQTDGYAEYDLYLDARNLLSGESRDDLLANAPEQPADDASSSASSMAAGSPQRYDSLDDPTALRTIEITEEHFGQYDEVYLTPLLRKLSDILGPDHDPKALVSTLEAAGAARLEKRDGYPYDYTVLIMNDDHPDVQTVHDEGAPSATTESTAAADENGSSSRTEEAVRTADDGSDETYEDYDYDEYAIDEALSDDGSAPDPQESVASDGLSDGSTDDTA